MTSDPRRDPRLPKDFPVYRPTLRSLMAREPRRYRFLDGLVTWVPTLGVGVLMLVLDVPEEYAMLAMLTVLGLVMWLTWGWRRRAITDQVRADDARADDIAANFGDGFALRRRFPRGGPEAALLALAFFTFLGWTSGFPPFAIFISAGLAVVTGIVIYLAVQNSGEFGRLTEEGMELGGKLFRWRQIRSVDPAFPARLNYHDHTPWIRVRLADPLTTGDMPRGGYWQFRLGQDHRELLVSMARTVEDPGVIYQLAEQLMMRDRARHIGKP